LDALQPALAHGPVRTGGVEDQPAVSGGLLPRRPDLAPPGVLKTDLVVGILVARDQPAKVLPRDTEDAVADGEVVVGVLVLAVVSQERVPLGGVLAVEQGDRLPGPSRGEGSGAQHQQAKVAHHGNLRGGPGAVTGHAKAKYSGNRGPRRSGG